MTRRLTLLASAALVAASAPAQAQVYPLGGIAACAAAAAGPPRVFALLDSFGANTHLGSGGSWYSANSTGQGVYANSDAKILGEAAYANIKYFRDSTGQNRGDVVTRMVNLNKQSGIKFDILNTVNNGTVDTTDDITQMVSLVQQAPGSILSFEGPNEYNTNSYTIVVNGTSTTSNNNFAFGAIADQAAQSAIAAQSALAGIPIVAASTAGTVPNPLPSVAPYVNATNWHVYGNFAQQLQANLTSALPRAQATSPSVPVYVTEFGVSSSPTTNPPNSFGSVGDRYVQGVYGINMFLDAFNLGYGKAFAYDLMDDNPGTTDGTSATGSTGMEDNFGLFDSTGAPKAFGVNVHNLTTILADSGSTAATFTTTAANFSVSGLPSGASYKVFQKSNGAYDIILWNSSLTLWNTSTSAEIAAPTTQVSIALGGTYSSVKTYDPVTGTAATATATNASSVTVGLAGEPQIVEVTK